MHPTIVEASEQVRPRLTLAAGTSTMAMSSDMETYSLGLHRVVPSYRMRSRVPQPAWLPVAGWIWSRKQKTVGGVESE